MSEETSLNKRNNQNFEIRKTSNMISKENPANRFMREPIKVSKLIQKIPYLFIGKQTYQNSFHFDFNNNNCLMAQSYQINDKKFNFTNFNIISIHKLCLCFK